MVLSVPPLDPVLLLITGKLMPVQDSLGDQLLGAEVTVLVHFFVIVSKFGLHCMGAEAHHSVWRAVNLMSTNTLLPLEEEKLLLDVLDEPLQCRTGP